MRDQMTMECGLRLTLDVPDHLSGVSFETLWSRFEAIHDVCTDPRCLEDGDDDDDSPSTQLDSLTCGQA